MKRNRPKQGVEGGSRRPTRNDYATVEEAASSEERIEKAKEPQKSGSLYKINLIISWRTEVRDERP